MEAPGGGDDHIVIPASVPGDKNDNAPDQDAGPGDGTTLCSIHPLRGSIPAGGICAFCLQKKLGELVISSPFPIHPRAPPSSSPSPPSRSGNDAVFSVPDGSSSSLSLPVVKHGGNSSGKRLPFLLAKRQKTKQNQFANGGASSSSSTNRRVEIVFRRSKSTATPNRGGYEGNYSPRKRGGLWSFLHLSSSYYSSSSKLQPNSNSKHKITCNIQTGRAQNGSSSSRRDKGGRENNAISAADQEDGVGCGGHQAAPSPSSSSSSLEQRKVLRSRSVGCGSRSFSGDFFERISNGFGDCTLRRVESQREGKPRSGNANKNREGRGERVRYCGGIFGGFVMTSSSSSSWASSSHRHDHHHHQDERGGRERKTPGRHGRSRSWGWAFASPVKALTAAYHGRPSSSSSSAPKDSRGCRSARDGVYCKNASAAASSGASVPSSSIAV